MNEQALGELAYQCLQGKLFRGECLMGQQLSEQSLAQEMSISRTPVREAIQRLVQEGFLDQKPRQGTFVRELSRDEIVAWFQLREALESYAVSMAAPRISAEALVVLNQLCLQMARLLRDLQDDPETRLDAASLHRFLSLDAAFHQIVASVVDNPRLTQGIVEAQSLIRFFAMQRRTHTRRMVADSVEMHDLIYSALKDRDAPLATQRMTDHLHRSRNQIIQVFDHQDRTGGNDRHPWRGVLEDLDLTLEPLSEEDPNGPL